MKTIIRQINVVVERAKGKIPKNLFKWESIFCSLATVLSSYENILEPIIGSGKLRSVL